MTKKKVFYCNTELAMDIVGGKWKPLIIYHLSYNEALRFGQFKKLIPNVNERVLSRALRELEEHGIILRTDYNENPPKVDYRLTPSGQALAGIVVQLGEWGKTYNDTNAYAEVIFDNKYTDDKC